MSSSGSKPRDYHSRGFSCSCKAPSQPSTTIIAHYAVPPQTLIDPSKWPCHRSFIWLFAANTVVSRLSSIFEYYYRITISSVWSRTRNIHGSDHRHTRTAVLPSRLLEGAIESSDIHRSCLHPSDHRRWHHPCLLHTPASPSRRMRRAAH